MMTIASILTGVSACQTAPFENWYKKVQHQNPVQYDFSDPFSLFVVRQNRLGDILRVLKRLAEVVAESERV
jgi:hypothetical protein